MKRRVFIGVAWPYVNGVLHIGHLAGYLLPADITARFFKATGADVLMISGSDCFGTPITLEADKRGIHPEKIVEEYHEKDIHLFLDTLQLSYSLYTKTNHPNHIKVTQDIFVSMLQQGYISKGISLQYYSASLKKFLPDRYVVGTCPFCDFKDARSDQCDNCGQIIGENELVNPKDNLNGNSLELRESEHYYLDWNKLQDFLESYVKDASENWKAWIKSETEGWLKKGLKPRAITRDLDWGVPIPIDRVPPELRINNAEDKSIYVWFDAVIGYLSASILWAKNNKMDWEDYWYNQSGESITHYYFMGKDNLVFHTLFWPGQLHVYDKNLHLPDTVSINMFLNFEGKQFSKSRGVTIGIKDIVEEYGNDRVRFYLTFIMPELKDSSFTWDDFKEKVNSVLIGNLGNFIQRTLSMGKNEQPKHFTELSISSPIKAEIAKTYSAVLKAGEECRFQDYLNLILNLSRKGNLLINEKKLWKLRDTNESEYYQILFDLYALIIVLSYLFGPILFEAQRTIHGEFGIKSSVWPEPESMSTEVENTLRKWSVPKNPKPLFEKTG